MPIYVFCAENVTLLEKAFKAGAQRAHLISSSMIANSCWL